jgi:putative flippase GtrA
MEFVREGKRLISYISFGGVGVSTDFIVFIILVRESDNLLLSNTVSTCCGISVSFILNSRFTFKSRMKWNTFYRFLIIGLLGLAFSSFYLKWLVVEIGIASSVAKASALPLIAVLQYLGNRHWTFRNN